MKDKKNWSHQVRMDRYEGGDVEFHYVSFKGSRSESEFKISDAGEILEIRDDFGNGKLLRVQVNATKYTIWIPSNPQTVQFDEHERIDSELWKSWGGGWSFYPEIKVQISLNLLKNSSVCFTYLKIEDPGGLIYRELQSIGETESKRYLKSEWFDAKSPSDFWTYFINGNLYDPRSAQNKANKRFRSQQCAFAWWGYFEMLSLQTGKIIYSLLQNEIARSITEDFEKNGTWRHGYWSDSMEIHSRFYLDGIHLLISQYEKTGESRWLKTADSAIHYFLKHFTDRFDNGNIWFLHDSMEGERKHKVSSTLFGKSRQNSLCINTHVQALCVLQKLIDHTDNKTFSEHYNLGLKALIQVLDHQPADLWFNLLEKYVLFYENRRNQANSPFPLGVYSLQRMIMHKLYWKILNKYPRLVYRSGFIERDLSFTEMSKRYHILNVKDLLYLYRDDKNKTIIRYIKGGVDYIKTEYKTKSMDKHLTESPFFIEYQEVLYLYDKLVEPVKSKDQNACEESIINTLGGVSLDYNVEKTVEKHRN